jgi:hypothetical protein
VNISGWVLPGTVQERHVTNCIRAVNFFASAAAALLCLHRDNEAESDIESELLGSGASQYCVQSAKMTAFKLVLGVSLQYLDEQIVRALLDGIGHSMVARGDHHVLRRFYHLHRTNRERVMYFLFF